MMETYENRIKRTIDEICEEHQLKAPIMVPSAGKLIAEYRGIDTAIQLFEGAADEARTRGNIFRSSAYEGTLEAMLIPIKTGIKWQPESKK